MEWESRLNRVRVATRDGDFDLSWDERGDLLGLVGGTPGGEGIVARFQAVGATRPVELTDGQKALVVRATQPRST